MAKCSLFTSSALAASMMISSALIAATKAPENATAYIASPQNGEVVGQTFTVRFGLKNMGIAPAGLERENTGHHHLLIDGEVPNDLTQPMAANVKHFGGGQTEAEITLPPGNHTLQLILGDQMHIPHQPPVISEKITVVVK